MPNWDFLSRCKILNIKSSKNDNLKGSKCHKQSQ